MANKKPKKYTKFENSDEWLEHLEEHLMIALESDDFFRAQTSIGEALAQEKLLVSADTEMYERADPQEEEYPPQVGELVVRFPLYEF